MAPSLSIEVWESIKKLQSPERQKLLERLLCEREPIHRFADIKLGDHLVRKGSTVGMIQYEHHFLCVGFESERKPKIVHYYNTTSNAIGKKIYTSCLSSGKAFEKLGKIQEMTLPHEEFIKDEDELQAEGREVERVVWPKELKRYSVEEIVERAERRKDERFFDVIKNNCESFVMWCLCDLNITLQATPVRNTLCEAGSAILRSIWLGIQQIPKLIVDLLDDFTGAVGRRVARTAADKIAPNGLPTIGVCVGTGVTVLVEAIMAAYKIRSAYKKWKDGAVIYSREKFTKEVIDIVLLALFRTGGSIAGMFVGQLVIPIPIVGGFVGAVVGVFGGHILAKILSAKCSENLARWIEEKRGQPEENSVQQRIQLNEE